MKAKLIVEGKEFDIEIQDPELQKLVTPKKTGYERVKYMDCFCTVSGDSKVAFEEDARGSYSQSRYDLANYYSDKTVAENNARADNLMRQLRRFAVEHRNQITDLYEDEYALIYFNYDANDIMITITCDIKYFGAICFDSHTIAKRAIETFHDELIWYFTEYKDSL